MPCTRASPRRAPAPRCSPHLRVEPPDSLCHAQVPNDEPRRLVDGGVAKFSRAHWDGTAWTREPRASMAVVTLYQTADRPILHVCEAVRARCARGPPKTLSRDAPHRLAQAAERHTPIELERGGAVALRDPRSVLLGMKSQAGGTGGRAALVVTFEQESDARTVLDHGAATPKRQTSGGEGGAAKLQREM